MPLDTSSYALALLRLDGRRWNELRQIHGQISTQAAADGSCYFEMGNTKVVCTVAGPEEGRRTGASVGNSDAKLEVEMNIAGFAGVNRVKRTRNDKRNVEMQSIIEEAFLPNLFLSRYPNSTISIRLHVLSQDGSLLAACLNACTLALIDAGVPMSDYIAACTAGSTSTYGSNNDDADPILDLNSSEEQDLPFLTLATIGATDQVSVLLMETRVQASRLDSMLAAGVDGCAQLRDILDQIVREHGKRMLSGEK